MVNRKGRVYGRRLSPRSKLRLLLTETEAEQLPVFTLTHLTESSGKRDDFSIDTFYSVINHDSLKCIR